MKPLQRIAAVIVTYNNARMLKSLLADLAGQTRRPDGILVIDNSTAGDAADVCRAALLPVRYLRMPGNTGSAGGYAEGIRLACEDHDAVWLLDDDVSAAPDALERLLEGFACLQQTVKVGAVRSWSSRQCPFTGVRSMTCFCWRGTLIPAEAVRTVGLPCREFFLYGEDQEYSLRLRRNGYTLFWAAASRVFEQRHEDKQCLSFLGLTAVVYREHAKLYYAFRNSARTYVLYGMWLRIVRLALFGVKVIVLAALTGRPQAGRVAEAVVTGLSDGCCAKMGVCRRYA